MEKRNELLKIGFVAVVFAICLAMMAIAISFAANDDTTELQVENPEVVQPEVDPAINPQATEQSIAQEEGVQAKETATENEITTEEVATPSNNVHVNFSINDPNVSIICSHIVYTAVPVSFDMSALDLNQGLTFTLDTVTEFECNLSDDGIRIGDDKRNKNESYDEVFYLELADTDDSFDVAFTSAEKRGDTVYIEISRMQSFELWVTAQTPDGTPLANYDLPMYLPNGEFYKNLKTDEHGFVKETTSDRNVALGYFYEYDPSTNDGFFQPTFGQYKPGKLDNSDVLNGICILQVYKDEAVVNMTGQQNHDHFVFAYNTYYDDLRMASYNYVLKDIGLVCPLPNTPSGNYAEDLDWVFKIDADGRFIGSISGPINQILPFGDMPQTYTLAFSLLPVAEQGYEFASWTYEGKNYERNQSVPIDLQIIPIATVANYRPVAPAPEPQPQSGEVTSTAKTFDLIPVSGIIAFAFVLILAFSIVRKQGIEF